MEQDFLIQIDDIVRPATPEEAAEIQLVHDQAPPMPEATDETPSPA